MTKPFSILLVEDDDPLRRCLAEVLADQGWRIHSTGLGQEAVLLARAVPIDFSILDLHLPGMSGLDVLQAMAREGLFFPSIMMSGQATREETLAALHAGVFTFLRKPLDLHDLRSSVQQLIQHHFGPPSGPTGGRPGGAPSG